MCQVCEMQGNGKRYLELKVQWTAQYLYTVQIKQLQDITISIVDLTKTKTNVHKLAK